MIKETLKYKVWISAGNQQVIVYLDEPELQTLLYRWELEDHFLWEYNTSFDSKASFNAHVIPYKMISHIEYSPVRD